MKSIYYFSYLNSIGGIEQFFYYLATKYHDRDLTIYYRKADPIQLMRLQKLVRCVQYKDETIECERAFFNFNTDIWDKVIAKDKYIVLHGDYLTMVEQQQLNMSNLPIKEGAKYLGVSQTVCDAWTKLTGLNCELFYNPYVREPKKKYLKIVYCGRLTKEKGGDLANKLINALDEQEIDYQFYVYSNSESIKGKNVIYLGTRLDAGQFLNKDNYDFCLIPSKNEGYCYTLAQSLSNGLPVVATPCPVFKELGVNEKNSIELAFDGSNIDDVIKKMLNFKQKFTFTTPDDRWGEILDGKSTYEGVKMKKIKAKDRYFDKVTGLHVKKGQIYETTDERARLIVEKGYAEYVKEVKNEENA